MIRRLGRETVRLAFAEATEACRHWLENEYRYGYSDHAVRLLRIFHGPRFRVSFQHRTFAAALYPQTVALTRLLAHPAWRERALSAQLLRGNPPALVSTERFEEFIAEIRRSVAPGYAWPPYPTARSYDQLGRSLLNELQDRIDPMPPELRHGPPPPEAFATT